MILLNDDCREAMPGLAENSVDAIVTDLAAGVAGEHFVCADLLLQGFRAFLADQNCPYDIAVDLGSRLVRLQVKSTRKARPIPQRSRSVVPAYMWHVRRAGKGGRRVYAADDFDLLALVALDARCIAYMEPSASSQTIHIRPPGSPAVALNGHKRGKVFEDYPFTRALEALR